MKINFVQTFIAIAVSLLISYGLYSFHIGTNKMLFSAGSFVFLAITLIVTIGVTFELPRTSMNIKMVASIFFVIALISNLVFTFSAFAVPSYIITNGILLLFFILIAYSINNAKQ